MAVTPITSTDAYHLKPQCEYLFRVTARNKFGWGESVVTSSGVKASARTGAPQFIQRLYSQMKALQAADMQLDCRLTGQPEPDVEWYRDGMKLPLHPRYEYHSIGGASDESRRHRLTIRGVQLETDDEAKFSCEAFNSTGRAATFARILVVTDPRVAEADAQFRQYVPPRYNSNFFKNTLSHYRRRHYINS